MIKGELPGHAVLLSNSGIQNFPNKLRRVPETFRDKNGMPLFEDLQREVYLSVKYHSVHTEYLRDFGVTDLTWSNMIARITPYFEGENPRFLRPDHDEDWHTRVANLLMEGLVSAAPVIRTKIRQLPLIPLRDGPLSNNWTDYIYFPTDTLGHAVPADLGLRVVDNNALRNNTRKSLYEKLGVQYCEPSFVISQIIKRYGSPLDIALSDSVSHLKYLYRTLSDDQALDECIFVMDQNEVPIYRKSVMFVMDKNEIPNHRSSVTTGKSLIADDLYFNTSGNFGTEHLAEELKTNGQPGLHIIHKAYLEAFSLREVINARRWKEWLKKKALIRKVPKLRHSSTSGISPVFNQIIKCRPQLLVGVLKRHWNSYKSQDSTSIKEYFKDATIPCRGAVSIRRRFENTYLPTPQLLTICQQACVENNFDYFLDLSTFPDEPIGNDLAEWEFLEVFGVGTKPDTEFFRIVLSTLTSKINGEDLKRGLFYIYEQISTELPNVDSTQIR